MPVTIHIIEGEPNQQHAELTLDKTTVLLGRGSEQDVRLTHPSVSRRHAVIEKREGQWSVSDENSENGTVLNGQKVAGQKVIRHGDVLELGEVMLRVGLDRKLKDEGKSDKGPSVPGIVRAISAFILLFVVSLAAAGGSLLWEYKQRMQTVTAKLPVQLEPVHPDGVPIFLRTEDERKLYYSALVNFPLWDNTVEYMVNDNPFPEWNTDDVWDTQTQGRHPRLFEGLDLNLKGGAQAIASGYFFIRSWYTARDDSDPKGELYIDLEGWSGLGERYANKEIIAPVRRTELPNFQHSVKILPMRLQEVEHDRFKDLALAEFYWNKMLYPPPVGDPIGPTKGETIITPSFLVPPKEPREVLMHGLNYSFFLDGNRYELTVHGSENLLQRFDGQLKGLTDAILESIKIETVKKRTLPPADQLATKIRDTVTILTAHSRRPTLLGVVTYPDLLAIRNLLLDLQTLPAPVAGEEELRRLYFVIRDRTQRELEVAMTLAFDNRMAFESKEGETELRRIKSFLAGYPPPTLKRRQTGYPEWAWYFEDVASVPPYLSLRSQ